jgi:protein ImuB
MQRWRSEWLGSRLASSAEPEPPRVLWRHDPRRGRRVVACNQAAAALGVRFDLPVGELAALLAPAPRAEQQRHDPVVDRQALRRLAEACQRRFSPLVAFEPLAERPWAGQRLPEPAALALEISGIGPLFHGEGSLLRQIVRWFASQGLRTHLASASSFGAAWAIAHCVVGRRSVGTHSVATRAVPIAVLDHISQSQFPAKQASGLARWLDPLPVAALRLPEEALLRLQRLGIDTIRMLRDLPREGLTSRFGPEVLQRLDQAFGRQGETLEMLPLPPSDQAQVRLEYPTEDRQILAHHLQQLLCELVGSWQARQQGALRLICRCDCVEPPCWEWVVGLFAPSADAEHLARLCLTELERGRPPAAVERVTVTATMLAPLEQRQTLLLPELSSDTDDSLAETRLIDTLSNRLGRQQVVGVEMTRDVQPERAYVYRPLAGNPRPSSRPRRSSRAGARRRPARSSLSASAVDQPIPGRAAIPASQLPGAAEATEPAPLMGPQTSDPGRRPLTLFEPPQPLEVLAVFPAGLPQHFCWRGQRYRVLHPSSAERIETGWWRGPTIRRDYYRVQTEHGQQFWLFRDLRDQQWYLHGRFD